MRISNREEDPGYEAWVREAVFGKQRVRVFLDGAEVKYCEVADEEEGFVICNPVDATGKPVLPKPGETEWPTETRRGVVKVVLEPKAAI